MFVAKADRVGPSARKKATLDGARCGVHILKLTCFVTIVCCVIVLWGALTFPLVCFVPISAFELKLMDRNNFSSEVLHSH